MNIVITENITEEALEHLKQSGHNIVYHPQLWSDRHRLEEEVTTADALIIRNQTRVDVSLLSTMKQTKIIGRLGVGLDNIDLETAKQLEIQVVSAKNANSISVAEYVFAAMLTFSRPLLEASVDVKNGGWNRTLFGGTELQGKTLGLIGLGEIGHRTAVRAKAFGMNVIGSDPRVMPYDFAIAQTGIQLVTTQELLEQSDFISLHVPLLPATKGLINATSLSQMKSNAVLINTARGGIVDEGDLYDALLHKRIAGAVLDVQEKEPPLKNHPLFSLSNCILTPHVAGLTQEANNRTSQLVASEVLKELSGVKSLCRVY